jgi:radical SAM superfamily enzyme YgiQ (UPF0313 family)
MKVGLILSLFDQYKSVGFKAKHAKRVYGYFLPLGIAHLAAILKRDGHDVAVLDPCPLSMDFKEIVEWIGNQQLDVLGISTLTHASKNAYSIAQLCKERFPDLPVVLGGTHCTVFPDTVMSDCPAVDVAVLGEAEERITTIMEALVAKSELESIPGLIYRDAGGQIRFTGKPPLQTDLDTLPFPARELFDPALYCPFPDQVRKTPVANLMTSRGCPWRRCKFCFEGGKFMPPYRRRSPESVMGELRSAYALGYRGAAFWDDNFCVNDKWVKSMCRLLRESGLGFTWSCCARVNTLTEAMIQEIKAAGCFTIYFGFESGDQATLDLIDKGTTLDQAREAVAACRKAGIESRGSFILGMPGDTPELAEKSIAFSRELDLDSVKFMLYTPEPGTGLYEIAKDKGQFLGGDFQGSLSRATYLPACRVFQRGGIGAFGGQGQPVLLFSPEVHLEKAAFLEKLARFNEVLGWIPAVAQLAPAVDNTVAGIRAKA